MTDVPFEQAPGEHAGLFGIETQAPQPSLAIIGVPWEPTASYGRGTSNTPQDLVPVSHQLDLFEPFLNRDFGHEVDFVPLGPAWVDHNRDCIERANPILNHNGPLDQAMQADLDHINAMCSKLNQALENVAREKLEQGLKVAVLGGDHSSPLGAIKACAHKYPDMGLLHVDAHHDLRDGYQGFRYSHASIMFNVLRETTFAGPLVSVGIRDFSSDEHALAHQHPKVITHYDRAMQLAAFNGQTWQQRVAQILEPLPRQVYVSFDIDGLDPKLCPHTGTPVPGGLDFGQACFLLESIVTSGREMVGFDLCEVAPGPTDWDLNVGARILHKLAAIACCDFSN